MGACTGRRKRAVELGTGALLAAGSCGWWRDLWWWTERSGPTERRYRTGRELADRCGSRRRALEERERSKREAETTRGTGLEEAERLPSSTAPRAGRC